MRDLVAKPLTIADFRKRPYILRSRWLVYAWEEKTRKELKFYLGSSDEFESPGTLAVAKLDSTTPRPNLSIVGDIFDETIQARKEMLRMIEELEAKDRLDRYGIIAPDMRLLA
ncbi:MAG: hypothetical protein AAFN70_15760 [Planctomycetota bacterium]